MRPSPTRPRWAQWTTRRTLTLTITLVLVGTASTAYGVDQHLTAVHAQHAATADHDQAVNALTTARATYTAALADAAAAAAAATTETVSDPSTVTALHDELTKANTLQSTLTAVDTAVPAHASTRDVTAATARLSQLRSELATTLQALTAATKAASDSHTSFLLAQADKAFAAAAADLTTVVTQARTALDQSAGKVADDTVRQALSTALTAATTAAGTVKATTPDAVATQTRSLVDTRNDLAAKTQAVTDAQAAWQSAQRSTPAPSPSSTTSSAKTSSPKAASAPSTKPSGTTGAPSAPTGGSATTSTAPSTQVQNQTRPVSTPAEALAGLQAARASAGLQTVSSCSQIPGAVDGGVGIVHALAWQEFLTSPDHRAIVMVPRPARMSAWNAADALGGNAIYVQVWACIVPS